ncbi:MAG: hypothetical protein FJ104_13895, partial [Deltaproteobacteria bacterium]|nr:hypothetical protein [Deltaproteobacteria bacterium]
MEDPRDRALALRAQVAELDLALARAVEARARVSRELAGQPELAGITSDGDREALLRLDAAPEGALP